ncbi:MAG TPA: hypothetical protein VD928_01355 [Candidatus Paceibacterota bacterium]|nr:hypothetical protein [Candidatus Paceibacterota bacterium]
MRTIAITYSTHLTRIMAVLAVITALSVFLYGIFLLEAVGNTASRARVQKDIRDVASRVSALEEVYLEKTRQITLKRAQDMGFVAPYEVTTVYGGEPIELLTSSGGSQAY